jgi:hypothetical protein
MSNKLPLYRATIVEDDNNTFEVRFISLVHDPAIEVNFLAFDNQQPRSLQFATNEEERVITGLAMIADEPIYRRDKEGEFYVYYDAAGISQIVKKFFRKKYNFNLNLNHKPDLKTGDGVYVFESWIVDREKGKFPMKQFSDVPNGSWIISAKVDDPAIWEDIKNGVFRGFSIEGFFKMERINDLDITEEQFDAEVEKLIREYTP